MQNVQEHRACQRTHHHCRICLLAGLIFLFSVGFVMGMLGVVGLIMMFMPALDGLYGLLKTLQSKQVVLAEGCPPRDPEGIGTVAGVSPGLRYCA